MGNLLAIKVHAANIHDPKAGEAVFAEAKRKYPTIQAVCADAGYRKAFKNDVEANHHVTVHISEKNQTPSMGEDALALDCRAYTELAQRLQTAIQRLRNAYRFSRNRYHRCSRCNLAQKAMNTAS